MARLIVAALMVLLGMVLISTGFQEYVDGSCGAGDCVFNRRLDDPLFVVMGVIAIAVGVLIFLNRFPLWRKQIVEPVPLAPEAERRESKYPARKDGNGFALFALLQANEMVADAGRGGGPWGTALLIALVIGALVAGVWFMRHRGPGAANRR